MTSVPTDLQSIEVENGDSRGKKPVWNVPSNGTIEVTPVVDAVSWPALSESTKSSSDSLKSLSESLPVTSSSSSKSGNSKGASNPNPNLNQVENAATPPTHHKSLKHGSSSNNHASQPPVSAPEISPRSSLSGSNEQHRNHTNGSRRGGNNGGGSHQSHGYREWNRNRNNHHMQRGGFRTYYRPQHFMGPTPFPRPIAGNAMGYAGYPAPMYYITPQQYPEAIRGMSFAPYPVPQAMFIPPFDPQRDALMKQIEYYFSSENLVKDLYLRSHMDEQGWVPISLIAGFNKVKDLTSNIPYVMQYLLDAIRSSPHLELQGDKLRSRNEWKTWMVPPPDHSGSASNASADVNSVAGQLQRASIDGSGNSANHNGRAGVVFTRSASGNLNNQFSVAGESGGAANGQLNGSQDSRSLPRCDTL